MSYNQDIIWQVIRDHPGCTASEISKYTDIVAVSIPLSALARDKRVRFEVGNHGRRRYWVIE